jgi:hypothetical protein
VGGPTSNLATKLDLRANLRQIASHTIKNPPLELEEIGVDAHPVAGILAVRGFQVLSLERGWTAVISLSAPLSRILRKTAQLSSRNRQTTNLGDARSHNVADLLTLRLVELHK